MITPPVSLKRGAQVLGAYLATMTVLAVAVVFLGVDLHATSSIVTLSIVTSLLAVLLPATFAFYVPEKDRRRVPPPYFPVSTPALAGVALLSLPVYALLAMLQTAIGVHMRVHAPTSASSLASHNPFVLVGLWLTLAVLPAFAEELLFRGVIQPVAIERVGLKWGLVASAAVFAFAHLNELVFVPLFLLGLWLGYLFLRSGSLWLNTFAHMLNNSWAVALANAPFVPEHHVPVVTAICLTALAAGLALLHREGLLGPVTLEGSADVALPRLVALRRPRREDGLKES